MIEKAREDQKATILYYKDEGRAEGKAEGLEQGLEQGEHKKQLEIARNMLKKGLALDLIAEITGLSKAALEELE